MNKTLFAMSVLVASLSSSFASASVNFVCSGHDGVNLSVSEDGSSGAIFWTSDRKLLFGGDYDAQESSSSVSVWDNLSQQGPRVDPRTAEEVRVTYENQKAVSVEIVREGKAPRVFTGCVGQ